MTPAGQIQNLAAAEVFGVLASRPSGLTTAEAQERLGEIGPNRIELRDRWRHLRSLFRQFANFFALLLIVSAGLCFAVEQLQPGENMAALGWALAGVALLNALFSFAQEYRAERAMEALRHYLPPKVQVRRDGTLVSLLADALVPGDVLILGEGDRVPADARLVEAHGLLVNNAPLTGEAQPLPLTAAAAATRLIDSPNVTFAGCLVLRGSGTAVVFATGLRTEFGKLAHLSQAIRRTRSPLERQTLHMMRVLTLIAVVLGAGFFLFGLASGRSLWISLVFMMGIIVANVPEGLLPTMTLALAMGSLRMARKNVLVKSLNAVEALGAAEVICTDKTGTLTRNELAVSRLHPVPATGPADATAGQRLLALALVASELRTGGEGLRGDPLDIAIAQRFAARGGDLEAALGRNRAHFPFDVEKRRAAGIGAAGDTLVFAVKGAWEALRPMLAEPEAVLAEAEAALHRMTAAGLRVVAVAARPLAAPAEPAVAQEGLESGLQLAGLLGVADPIRPEVPAALAKCHSAGISVLMITGDHPETARAVARQCGIIAGRGDTDELLTGDRLEVMTEAEVAAAIDRGVRIFARTTPAQKMKIVTVLKNMDRVVAMTGDGVNDAPALKAADVGIAMGKSGTDVARATAQIVLLDDNFASIVNGVEEGRAVFANIRKFTTYVLASNVPEILPYLLFIVLPVPLALTVIQILAIDLGTDMLPAIALGQEPAEPELMQQPPRGPKAGLLTPDLLTTAYLFIGLIEAFWSLFLFFLVLHLGGWRYGDALAASQPLYHSATGIALAGVLLLQVGNGISRRHQRRSGLDRSLLDNRLLLLGIALEMTFAWALLYWPPLQRLLGTGPVAPAIFVLAWLGIPLVFGLDLLRKRLRFQAA
ncbi:MAG: cation-transporting P-type ATPase [Deltaproteobacteria bacterium]|nr:MAG: cation-transporting P-type ATPase [Deltaproteobacteria bacterium]